MCVFSGACNERMNVSNSFLLVSEPPPGLALDKAMGPSSQLDQATDVVGFKLVLAATQSAFLSFKNEFEPIRDPTRGPYWVQMVCKFGATLDPAGAQPGSRLPSL